MDWARLTSEDCSSRRERTPRMRSWFAALCVLALAGFGPLGCAERLQPKEKSKFNSGLPGIRTQMQVDALVERGPYLEAALSFESSAMWAYAAPSEGCRAVFEPGGSVEYVDNGPLGEFRRDELDCQILGVGNLELWRDRNRRATPAGIPRAQANFELLHADEELTLLRGRFPLATAVGFSGGMDLVAVVENTKNCEGPVAKGTASMEYRGKGKLALTLVGKSGLCRIRGLIQPLPSAQPRVKKGED